ncbi:hypothetical protein NM688_g8309 [Phlebia brevispora]|uniref:Uncharacterized protein n=1 Tax=Phlebia brevispora TaxID=194682 RepID=A0ACC1RUS2_9APHY|nr:hypothetical protein NM688_g8309 [Phlebia brevispora]
MFSLASHFFRGTDRWHCIAQKQLSALATESLLSAPEWTAACISLTTKAGVILKVDDTNAWLAHRILSRIDDRNEGTKPSDASTSPYHPLHTVNHGSTEMENPRYEMWREQFIVNDSLYPDDMIQVLRNITNRTTSLDGWTFWRIRRLQDIERGASTT